MCALAPALPSHPFMTHSGPPFVSAASVPPHWRRAGEGTRASMPWNSGQLAPPVPGTLPLCTHLVLVGRWVCWPVLPACQLARSSWWLAPGSLRWAACPPPTGMQLAVRSRWTQQLSIKLPTGSVVLGALAPPDWCHWAGRLTHWPPMDGQLAPAAERMVLGPHPECPSNIQGSWLVGTSANLHPAITKPVGRRNRIPPTALASQGWPPGQAAPCPLFPASRPLPCLGGRVPCRHPTYLP